MPPHPPRPDDDPADLCVRQRGGDGSTKGSSWSRWDRCDAWDHRTAPHVPSVPCVASVPFPPTAPTPVADRPPAAADRFDFVGCRQTVGGVFDRLRTAGRVAARRRVAGRRRVPMDRRRSGLRRRDDGFCRRRGEGGHDHRAGDRGRPRRQFSPARGRRPGTRSGLGDSLPDRQRSPGKRLGDRPIAPLRRRRGGRLDAAVAIERPRCPAVAIVRRSRFDARPARSDPSHGGWGRRCRGGRLVCQRPNAGLAHHAAGSRVGRRDVGSLPAGSNPAGRRTPIDARRDRSNRCFGRPAVGHRQLGGGR